MCEYVSMSLKCCNFKDLQLGVIKSTTLKLAKLMQCLSSDMQFLLSFEIVFSQTITSAPLWLNNKHFNLSGLLLIFITCVLLVIVILEQFRQSFENQQLSLHFAIWPGTFLLSLSTFSRHQLLLIICLTLTIFLHKKIGFKTSLDYWSSAVYISTSFS